MIQEYRWHLRGVDRPYPEDELINGQVEYGARLPLVLCPDCGGRLSSGRYLPVECPREILEEVELRCEQEPVSIALFSEWASRWKRQLPSNIDLQPGDVFQPSIWRIASAPSFQMYWPQTNMVFSEDLVDLLRGHDVSGIRFHRLTLRLARDNSDRDLHTPGGADFEAPEVFYEVELMNHTMDEELIRTCNRCGIQYGHMNPKYRRRKGIIRSKGIIPTNYVLDTDVFWSHIHTGGCVVNDKIMSLLSSEALENTKVTKLRIEEYMPA